MLRAQMLFIHSGRLNFQSRSSSILTVRVVQDVVASDSAKPGTSRAQEEGGRSEMADVVVRRMTSG